MNQYSDGKVKSTPTRGVKQYLKLNAYKQSEPHYQVVGNSAVQSYEACDTMPHVCFFAKRTAPLFGLSENFVKGAEQGSLCFALKYESYAQLVWIIV